MAETSAPLRKRVMFGCVIWILSIQYFVIELIAQHAWVTVPYTRFNTISDLGATACGTIPMIVMRTVACSPLHALMNAAFVMSGVLTIVGLYFARSLFPKTRGVSLASLSIALGALGAIGVGLFPENEHLLPHTVSAFTVFTFSNLGIFLFGIALYRSGWHRKFAVLTIVLGLSWVVGLCLLPWVSSVGIGVIERFVAYPETLWVIIAGSYFAIRQLLGR